MAAAHKNGAPACMRCRGPAQDEPAITRLLPRRAGPPGQSASRTLFHPAIDHRYRDPGTRLPGLRIPVSELLWPPQSCLRRQPDSRPKTSKLPPRSRMSSPPSSPGTSPRPSRFPPRSSGSSSEFKVALEFQPNNIETQSYLRTSPSIPEALGIGSKSPEVTLWPPGVASEWYPFSLVGKFYSARPISRKGLRGVFP